jgi:hypothetical protein
VSQSVAPQPSESPVVQVAVQQWPVPATPQMLLVHDSLLLQVVPADSWARQEPAEQ